MVVASSHSRLSCGHHHGCGCGRRIVIITVVLWLWSLGCQHRGHCHRNCVMVVVVVIVVAVVALLSWPCRYHGSIYCFEVCGEVSEEVAGWSVSCAHPMGTLPGPPGTSPWGLLTKHPPHIPFGWGGGEKKTEKKKVN
jgi:hypothetical protein